MASSSSTLTGDTPPGLVIDVGRGLIISSIVFLTCVCSLIIGCCIWRYVVGTADLDDEKSDEDVSSVSEPEPQPISPRYHYEQWDFMPAYLRYKEPDARRVSLTRMRSGSSIEYDIPTELLEQQETDISSHYSDNSWTSIPINLSDKTSPSPSLYDIISSSSPPRNSLSSPQPSVDSKEGNMFFSTKPKLRSGKSRRSRRRSSKSRALGRLFTIDSVLSGDSV